MSDLKNLKAGDSVIYKNVGFGYTTYERADGDVIEIKDGNLFTKTFDRMGGMVWDDRTQSWKSDHGLGLVCYAISADDPLALIELAAADAEEAEG